MKIKITKRDILFFFIGVFTLIIIDVIWDWDNAVKGFKDGYNDARSAEKIY